MEEELIQKIEDLPRWVEVPVIAPGPVSVGKLRGLYRALHYQCRMLEMQRVHFEDDTFRAEAEKGVVALQEALEALLCAILDYREEGK